MFEVGSFPLILIGISALLSVTLAWKFCQWIAKWWEILEHWQNAAQDWREACINCTHRAYHLGVYDRDVHEIVCPCPVQLKLVRKLDWCDEWQHWTERGW